MNGEQFVAKQREHRRADLIGKIVAAVFVVLMVFMFGFILYHVHGIEGS